MKYLFFDIECSNCFNGVGKMCEFGYVLTDENFHVMKSGDIPMSPGRGEGNRFHLKGRKNEKDLELAYEYSYYLEQPEFPKFHKQIKSLVEDPDTICFAYSMDNDIPHLYHACTRYKLQPFNYVCYDVQKLVAAYLEKKGQMSLRNACLKIVGPNSVVRLQEHLSRDDAEMERLIFEAICILTKTNSKELLGLFCVRQIIVFDLSYKVHEQYFQDLSFLRDNLLSFAYLHPKIFPNHHQLLYYVLKMIYKQVRQSFFLL